MSNLLWIAGALITLSGAIAVILKCVRWGSALTEGQRASLRSEILKVYYHCKDRGDKIHQYEAENVGKLYEAYKALGGNSFIDNVVKEIWEFELIK